MRAGEISDTITGASSNIDPVAQILRRHASGRQELLADLDRRFSPAGIRSQQRRSRRAALRFVLFIRLIGMTRRLCDLAAALLFLLALLPLMLLLFAVARMRGGGMAKELRLGRWATLFSKYEFEFGSTAGVGRRIPVVSSLPTLLNIAKGEMSFVGPRAVSPSEVGALERGAWKRYDIRPGLISLWWIRKRANIAYSNEATIDAEYTESHSLWGDLGIALRALPALAYGKGVAEAPEHLALLGIPVDNLTMAEAVARILELARDGEAHQLCFVNADCVNIACRDAEYKRILRAVDIVLADGIGVRLAGKLLNQNIRENVNGTDLFPMLCEAAERERVGIYLLGGLPGVAQAAAQWVGKHYPGLPVGYRHGFFTPDEEPEVLEGIRESGAAVVLVALGVPRQEKWIYTRLCDLGPGMAIGVGGLLDFYSGRIARAPVWMRELGMEWFYRFLREPRRMWRRYFVGNAVFLARVMHERWFARRAAARIEASRA